MVVVPLPALSMAEQSWLLSFSMQANLWWGGSVTFQNVPGKSILNSSSKSWAGLH